MEYERVTTTEEYNVVVCSGGLTAHTMPQPTRTDWRCRNLPKHFCYSV